MAGCDEPVDCYSQFIRGAEPSEKMIQRAPFPKARLQDDAGKLLGSVLYADGDLAQAVSTVAGLIGASSSLPASLECVAASQAIEAISRIDADMESIPDGEYRQIRK